MRSDALFIGTNIAYKVMISNYKNYCEIVKPNAVSIDYDINPTKIIKEIDIPIQGGLDPKVLLSDKETIKKEAKRYLDILIL